MRVFISWSGDQSREVAEALHDWLPKVVQSIDPYVSAHDIDKGARWATDIARELEGSAYGILCITKDNTEAPWLNFEAGALSKSIDRGNVAPFLLGIKQSDVPDGPILQFQATVYEQDDVRKLVASLNAACGDSALDEGRLTESFNVWWPKLEGQLNEVVAKGARPRTKQRRQSDADPGLLEEMLNLVRQQHRLLHSPEDLLPPGYVESVFRQSREVVRGRLPRLHRAVFADLEASWDRFEEIIARYSEDDMIAIQPVQEVFAALRKPIEYILRRERSPDD